MENNFHTDLSGSLAIRKAALRELVQENELTEQEAAELFAELEEKVKIK